MTLTKQKIIKMFGFTEGKGSLINTTQGLARVVYVEHWNLYEEGKALGVGVMYCPESEPFGYYSFYYGVWHYDYIIELCENNLK